MQLLNHISALLALGSVAAAASLVTKREIGPDEVILIGMNGTQSIMKAAEYDNMIAAQPAGLGGKSNVTGMPSTRRLRSRSSNSRRDCAKSSEVQVLSDQSFLNWDVALSPVVSAQGGTATVGISKGISLSNSITVGVTEGLNIENVLGLSYQIQYQETWQTTDTQTYTFTVPAGQYGLIVSQPFVRRIQGNYLSGCQDSWTSDAFTADSYTSQSSDGLDWVTGAIRLCNSTTYPVPYCNGQGSHT